jgi:hypothetical protein
VRRLRYQSYIQSARWQRKRQQALRHYRHRCMLCGLPGADTVHHIVYQHLGCERMFELVSLHQRCHDLVTALRGGAICPDLTPAPSESSLPSATPDGAVSIYAAAGWGLLSFPLSDTGAYGGLLTSLCLERSSTTS